ncbi:MAG: hypothetical protein V1727_06845 [Candidatus Omnitrophota bacterium]
MIFGLFKGKAKTVKVKKIKIAAKGPAAGKCKVKKAKKPLVKKTALRAKKAPAKKTPAAQIVGKVTHYFPRVNAGVILVTKGTIAVGDTLQIKGHTTDFQQKITSMQMNNAAIQKAKGGDEIGILVKEPVRDHDIVYKL